jgi:hypothetical protein
MTRTTAWLIAAVASFIAGVGFLVGASTVLGIAFFALGAAFLAFAFGGSRHPSSPTRTSRL